MRPGPPNAPIPGNDSMKPEHTHPYIPLTAAEEQTMLQTCGMASIQELFECIPPSVREAFQAGDLPPKPLSEMEVVNELSRLADSNRGSDRLLSFLGGGSYDHHVPSIINTLIFRSEFATAYTPYQPEVSQGTLQAIFEFQTLICNLTGLEAANASLYDGATAVAEAALMACGATRRERILISTGVNPRYRDVLSTYLHATDREETRIELLPSGRTCPDSIEGKDVAAVIVASPNYMGVIENLASLRARLDQKTLLIVVASPIALGLLAPPGPLGADVVIGEGAVLGVGQNYGGPGLGFMAVTGALTRRVPGRLVGMARDGDGKRGYVLTLQAREQHIRRAKASSNICTNQSLAALAATIFLTSLGKTGMRKLARLNYHKAHFARNLLCQIPGVVPAHDGPFFNEFAVRLPVAAGPVLERLLEEEGIVAGLSLASYYPNIENGLLVAVTEKRTRQQIERLGAAMKKVLS